MTPDQKNLLTKALAYDVQFQKIVAQIAKYIHLNPAPNVEWIDTRVADADVLVNEWLIIAEQVREAFYFQDSTVVDYFTASLKLEMEGLSRFPARVRLRLEEGVVPEFKQEKAEVFFNYTPETYMNEATKRLAAQIGVDLL
jgi:hypothetical protein